MSSGPARYLITGASGFVGRHFIASLEAAGVPADVLGVSRSSPTFETAELKHVRCTFRRLDLLEKESLGQVLDEFRPHYVLHLAASSSVGYSWHHPVESFANNTNIFLNLLDQIRVLGLTCRVLSVGSSEEYGNVSPDDLPLGEDFQLRPLSPYAVARVSQELLSSVYVNGYGLDVIMTRSFNHTGPFQRDAFVVPSLARQLVAISKGEAPPQLVTGNREIIRDFVDVRDVVRAYQGLFEHGTAGEIYNVCSGIGTSIGEIIELMQERLGTQAQLETDRQLIRPNDNLALVGSHAKLSAATGWRPEISLRDSVGSVVAYWLDQ